MNSAFVMLSPEPAWIFDRESLNILDVNDIALQTLGYDRDELVGKTIEIFRRPEELSRLHAVLKTIETTMALGGRWSFLKKTGETVDVDLTWLPIDYEGRKAVLAWARVVTDLVAAEAELTKANLMLKAASRVAELGSWKVDAATDITTWSDEIFELLGIPALPALTREQVFRHYAPEYHESTLQTFVECMTVGTPIDQVVQAVTASNKRLWVRIVGEAVRDASGRITGAQGAMQNIDNLITERDRSTRLARRLKLILETMEEGFLTLDHDLNLTFANRHATRLFKSGKSLAKVDSLMDLLPAEAAKKCREAANKAVATGVAQTVECYFPPIEAWYRASFIPTAQDIAVYLHDITIERRHAVQLRLLETAISTQNDILEITEATREEPHVHRYIYVNPAFERVTGYSSEEVIGKTPAIHAGPLTDIAGVRAMQASKAAGLATTAEAIHYRKDGSHYWKEMGSHPIFDDEGYVTNWVTTSRDITARKEAEAALRLSNERFHLVARATHELLWDLDLANKRAWWSDAFLAFTGYPNGSANAQYNDWLAVVHPEDYLRVETAWNALLASTAEIWEGEYRLRRADGGYAVVHDRAFISRDAKGVAVRAVGSMADVTEQIELAEKLRQSQKAEAFNQMTGGVAHDFNNLLTVILGNSELIADSAEPDSRLARLANGILDAAERGAELTSQLLSYASQKAMAPKRVDLNDVVSGFDAKLRELSAVGITAKIKVADDLWQAEVDAKQLDIALGNLATNAVEAMPAGGTLTLQTANSHLDHRLTDGIEEVAPGDYVCVTVSDTGTGINPENIERIFEPYFTTKAPGEGAGLGLSMVYGFVKQSGGHLQVQSSPGKGTSFRLYFPRVEGAERQAAVAGTAAAKPAVKAHILVVEDDPMVSGYVLGQLRHLGYQVSSAENGPEAIGILEKDDSIQLLFSDVIMPGGMNGRQLAEAAKSLRPGIKVVLTSGYTDNAIFRDGKVEEGMHFLGKPYHRQDLADLLSRVLHS